MAFGKSSTEQLKGWRDAGVSFGEALGKLTVVALDVVASLSVVVRAVQQLAYWALKISGQGGSDLAIELESNIRASEQGEAVRKRLSAQGKSPLEAAQGGLAAAEITRRTDLPRRQEMAARLQESKSRGPTVFGIPLLPSTTAVLPEHIRRRLSQSENFTQKRDTLLRNIEAIGGKDARESIQIQMENYTPQGQLRMLGEWLKVYKGEATIRPSTPPPTPVPGEKTAMHSRPMNPTAMAITGGNTPSEYPMLLA
jgi:hypothetical protein